MGRPKVLPANRLRANTACTACRASKKRCSGSFPCTNCVSKGRGHTCIPFKSISNTDSRNRRESTISRQPLESIPTAWSEINANLQSPRSSQIQDASPSDRLIERPLEAGSRSPEATHRTHPRMLRNLQGERVYVGKAASLSFLQLLRETVTQHIGPSQFSHNYKSEDMLETEAHHDPLNFSEEHCSIEEKRRFIKTFSIATSGFIYMGCDTDALLSDQREPKTSREEIHAAIGDLMIAIGAQSCSDEPENVQVEQFFVERGQRRAFASMLEDPSLDIVRVFLLLSFYMFGACRRNAAFMYLGVASRAAVALGLHVDSSGSLSPIEQKERCRLWTSLCVIDLLASSILGRPAATAGLLPGSRRDLSLIESTPAEVGLVASYQLSLIVDEITSRLYSERAASTETADLLLAKLNRWSDQLPECLRIASETEDSDAAQERIIGNMHVACSYHFAVILVTRPFLISTLSVRLARLHQAFSTDGASETLEEDPAHSRLAAACIDSAVYMLQTCKEIHQSELLLRQMSLLKAFVFAAALVLGFSMFSHRDVDTEIDNAFTGALSILQMLAQQSEQAAHYLEILTLLEAAVTQQRQRLSAQARQRRSQYVSRIFSLSDTPSTPRMQGVDSGRGGSATPLLVQGGPFYPWIPNDEGAAIATPPIMDGAFLDWEGMELPLWDSFPFTEPGSSVL
ncbi:uncharacterized protein N7496_007588 [Penicillium cataractarum]|uniref:Zn(2)-C6 fungal-type domain-containing protein n=1 Tax=Penicillium cataractarum TaxID=2100454 RepID=A0A9W9S3U4_9EURO|nr:uncharacterized protein N7496_007588 [Penicillium cataractarum]KAJ5371496.1 hypothetical protein N7496_007588 [Penicillium cataractarum]